MQCLESTAEIVKERLNVDALPASLGNTKLRFASTQQVEHRMLEWLIDAQHKAVNQGCGEYIISNKDGRKLLGELLYSSLEPADLRRKVQSEWSKLGKEDYRDLIGVHMLSLIHI